MPSRGTWRGYDLGGFPSPWAEWNDHYRDSCAAPGTGRPRPWPSSPRAFPDRPTSSARRSPIASINFVTAHDGFTLADLVSYERKHNDDNGEHNRDGTRRQRLAQRRRRGAHRRPAHPSRPAQAAPRPTGDAAAVAGVPMLLAGDEIGRTQLGNNNAYCQDNETSWLAWPYDRRDPAGPDPLLIPLVSGLLRLRRRSPVLRRTEFFLGGLLAPGDVESPVPDISWFRPDGRVMHDDDWNGDTVTLHLSGQALRSRLAQGQRIVDDSYVIVLHTGSLGHHRRASRAAVGTALRAAARHRRRRSRRFPAPDRGATAAAWCAAVSASRSAVNRCACCA